MVNLLTTDNRLHYLRVGWEVKTGAGLSLSSISVVDTCSQGDALVTWVTHPTIASCEAGGWWHPAEPCPPRTALVLVVLWHLFLHNFMVFEFSPLSSLSRTLSSKMLSYSFQRAAIGRCNHAFLCHYLGSWWKISHRIILWYITSFQSDLSSHPSVI